MALKCPRCDGQIQVEVLPSAALPRWVLWFGVAVVLLFMAALTKELTQEDRSAWNVIKTFLKVVVGTWITIGLLVWCWRVFDSFKPLPAMTIREINTIWGDPLAPDWMRAHNMEVLAIRRMIEANPGRVRLSCPRCGVEETR
jgi:hypothetical protein